MGEGQGYGNSHSMSDLTAAAVAALVPEAATGQPARVPESHDQPVLPSVSAAPADVRVLRQLYEWGEYAFLKPSFHLSYILDAGANIGIASVLFATM